MPGAAAGSGVTRLPNWVGDRVDEEGGQRALVDTSESEAYMRRKAKEKWQKDLKQREGGPSLAALMNHVVTKEPAAREQREHPDDGGGPDDGAAEGGSGEPGGQGGGGGIQALIRNARDPDHEADYF